MGIRANCNFQENNLNRKVFNDLRSNETNMMVATRAFVSVDFAVVLRLSPSCHFPQQNPLVFLSSMFETNQKNNHHSHSRILHITSTWPAQPVTHTNNGSGLVYQQVIFSHHSSYRTHQLRWHVQTNIELATVHGRGNSNSTVLNTVLLLFVSVTYK